ncbi:MAG: tetratricopeptide repeat protein [Acidobacteria bacterium]|nr:MAG: tetratricopeptide repeat protein [Acidobacteriota bacterium]
MTEDRMPAGKLIRPLIALACLLWFALPVPAASKKGAKRTLAFAAEMAQVGSWHEATFRWNSVLSQDGDNAHLHNNLAVAAEALGNWDEAAAYYKQALKLETDNFHIQENQRRFLIFLERLRRHADGEETAPERLVTVSGGGAKRKGKTFQVTVGLPMPPRLKLEGDESILIIDFLADETRFLDINREMVRFLRSAFRNRTAHEILDIVPPPAVPEQTIEDLLANTEFWKHLHREYGADLIVSGVLGFDREDISGYRDVDVVSPTTGQKVRQTRFVEQERFSYHIEVFFIDGKTGKLLYRDKLQRSAIIRGTQNDPITTFFDLSDTISAEVLAIVTTQIRSDTRRVFKY